MSCDTQKLLDSLSYPVETYIQFRLLHAIPRNHPEMPLGIMEKMEARDIALRFYMCSVALSQGNMMSEGDRQRFRWLANTYCDHFPMEKINGNYNLNEYLTILAERKHYLSDPMLNRLLECPVHPFHSFQFAQYTGAIAQHIEGVLCLPHTKICMKKLNKKLVVRNKQKIGFLSPSKLSGTSSTSFELLHICMFLDSLFDAMGEQLASDGSKESPINILRKLADELSIESNLVASKQPICDFDDHIPVKASRVKTIRSEHEFITRVIKHYNMLYANCVRGRSSVEMIKFLFYLHEINRYYRFIDMVSDSNTARFPSDFDIEFIHRFPLTACYMLFRLPPCNRSGIHQKSFAFLSEWIQTSKALAKRNSVKQMFSDLATNPCIRKYMHDLPIVNALRLFPLETDDARSYDCYYRLYADFQKKHRTHQVYETTIADARAVLRQTVMENPFKKVPLDYEEFRLSSNRFGCILKYYDLGRLFCCKGNTPSESLAVQDLLISPDELAEAVKKKRISKNLMSSIKEFLGNRAYMQAFAMLEKRIDASTNSPKNKKSIHEFDYSGHISYFFELLPELDSLRAMTPRYIKQMDKDILIKVFQECCKFTRNVNTNTKEAKIFNTFRNDCGKERMKRCLNAFCQALKEC